MLQPRNKTLSYFLRKKLVDEYNLVKNYNWYNLKRLISNIELYNLKKDIDILDKEDDIEYNNILKMMIENMNLGYSYWEFYNNLIPFIKKICK